MLLSEIFLIGAITLMVALSVLDRTQKRIKTNKVTLLRAYYETIAILWLPVFFLIIHIAYSSLSFSAIGFSWQSHWQFLTAAILLVLIISYFIFAARSLVNDNKAKQALAKELSQLAWLMPSNKKQLTVFTCGVSVSAGICEELIFRGYLLHVLSPHIGVPFAVIISSAIFGICHSYQGIQNVLRTSIIGIVFCLVYLFSETLIIPIILHIAIDVYGGITSYIARNYLAKHSVNYSQASISN